MVQPLWKFLKKLKIDLPYDPAIPQLGRHPAKTIMQKNACTLMFAVALFTITRTWEQLKCPSTEELIQEMFYIFIMEYL